MKRLTKKIVVVLFPVSLVVLCFFLVPAGKKNKRSKTESLHVNPLVPDEMQEQNPVKITIQPLGSVSAERLAFVKNEIAGFYKNSVVSVNAALPLPLYAWYEPRQRYVADSLLRFLLDVKTEHYDFIIGITEKDIATRKGKNPNYGVMGLGFCPGQACVVSTFRLKKKWSTPQAKSSAEKILRERFSKVCLHELGHNFGLPHCADSDSCLMHDANGTIAQVDKETKFICRHCRNRIKSSL